MEVFQRPFRVILYNMNWYLAALGGATIASAVGTGLLVGHFDPFLAGGRTQLLFYISLFLTIWGVLTLFLSRIAKRTSALTLHVALRRGFLSALAPVGLSVLARIGRFNTVSAIILIAGLAVLELTALWRSRKNAKIEDFS